MATGTVYPTNLDNFSDKVDYIDDVLAEETNDQSSAIEALQVKVGVTNSSDPTSHEYKINNIIFPDPTTTRGDLIYRGAVSLTRLAVGTANYILKSDGTDPVWISPEDLNIALPKGYIKGLVPSNDSGDTEHDLNITAGQCRDLANSIDIVLSSEITKQIDANWAEGDDAGGFPSGLSLTADTDYLFFIILKDDGTVDAGFDEASPPVDLLADATDYAEYRCVARVTTDSSSNIINYTAVELAGGALDCTYESYIRILNDQLGATEDFTAVAQIGTWCKISLFARIDDDDLYTIVKNASISDTPSESKFDFAAYGLLVNDGFTTGKTNIYLSTKQIYWKHSAAVNSSSVIENGFIDERLA